MTARSIYLDSAAASWPKPPAVVEAMHSFLEDVGANPGRSGHHLSIEAARRVYDAREAVAELVGATDPLRVVFGANLSEGINLALRGLLHPGDHVVTSSMEHNAMMRTLRALEASHGVSVSTVPCSPRGELNPCDLARAIRPQTKLIALIHASNVCGTLLPVAEAGRIAREHNLLLLVDSAQTAGAYPLQMEGDGIDLLAFTGNKSLMGPPGTGGLVLGPRVDPARMVPLKTGGTGSASASEAQPDFLPDRFESGTLNGVGLAGLATGVRWVLAEGVTCIRQRERELTCQLIDGLQAIPGVTVLGTQNAERQTATVAFTLTDHSPAELSHVLDCEDGILCRAGLHCSPAAHRTLGTFPTGAVRLSPGPWIKPEEITRTLAAIARLAKVSA